MLSIMIVWNNCDHWDIFSLSVLGLMDNVAKNSFEKNDELHSFIFK